MAVHPPKRTVLSTLALACASLLTACGGGGGGNNNPATPPGDSVPQATASVYSVAETSGSSGTSTSRVLHVVDTRTGAIVQSHPLPTTSVPGTAWHVVNRLQMDADGLGATNLGPSHLYLVQDGRILQVNMLDALGEPTQISALANACTIDAQSLPTRSDGSQNWLRVLTAGPDGDCLTADDNQRVLVASGMSTTTQALDAGPQGLEPLAILPGAQGLAQGIVAFDRRTATLGLYTNALARQAEITVPDHAPTATESLAAQPFLAGSDPRILLKLGASVYVLNPATSPLKLGAPALTLHAAEAPLVTATDSVYVYVADSGKDGHKVHALAPSGTSSLLATLDADAGPVVDLHSLSRAVLARQSRNTQVDANNNLVGPSTTLSTLNKSGNAPAVALASSTGYLDLPVLAKQGDIVYFAKLQTPVFGRPDLLKADALTPGATPTLVSNPVGGVLAAYQAQFRQTERQPVSNLIWCELATAPTALECSGGALKALDVATGQVTTLGTMPSTPGTYLRQSATLWAGTPALLTFTGNSAPATSQDTLWLADLGTPSSLKAVVSAP